MNLHCRNRFASPPKLVAALVLLSGWTGLCLSASAAITVLKQEVNPPKAQPGQMFRLSLTLSGPELSPSRNPAISTPNLSKLHPGLTISLDRSRSERRIINGRVQIVVSYIIIPRIKQPSLYRVPGWNITVEKQPVSVKPFSIEVVENGVIMVNGQSIGSSSNDVIFADIKVTPRNPVKGQLCKFQYVLHVGPRYSLSVGQIALNDSDWTQATWKQRPQAHKRIKNQTYRVVTWLATAVPKKEGEITVAPKLPIEIRMSMFDKIKRQLPVLNPVTLQVRPIPEEGRPVDFTGAAGKFEMSVTANPTEVKVGDPITLHTVIRATDSRVDFLTPPPFPEHPHFRAYEVNPLTRNDIHETRSGKLYDERHFEQVVAATGEAVTEIPPLTFSYFDVEKNAFRQLSSGPIPISVTRAAGSQSVSGAPVASGSKKTTHDSDIIYLKTQVPRWQTMGQKFWYTRPGLLAMQAVPVVGLALCFLMVRRREQLQGDQARARRLQAPRLAREGIRQAQAALKNGDEDGFWDGIWEGLRRYYGNALNLGAGELAADRVVPVYEHAGLEPADARRMRELFSACEARRYGQADEQPDQQVLEDLKRILKQCETLSPA